MPSAALAALVLRECNGVLERSFSPFLCAIHLLIILFPPAKIKKYMQMLRQAGARVIVYGGNESEDDVLAFLRSKGVAFAVCSQPGGHLLELMVNNKIR